MRIFAPLCALLVAAGEGAAAVRPEFTLAFVQTVPMMKTTYVHRYQPQFYYGTVVSAATEQTVDVSARGIGSFSFGAAFFFGGRFGLRLSTTGFESSLSGSTTPDRVVMTYIAQQPPDYVERAYSVDIEGAVAAPYGLQRVRSYSLDLLWRVGGKDKITLDVSGGLSLLRFDADLKTFGFRRFWLGGHSVLFSTLALLRMTTDEAMRMGVNFGAAVNFPLARILGLYLEARCILGPKTGLPVHFAIMDTTEGYYPGPSTLDGLEGAAPLTVNPSFWTLAIGVRFSPFVPFP